MIKNRKHHWANLCTKANCHETKANCHHPIWLDCNCQSHLPPAIVKNAGVLDVLWGCALFLISFFSKVFWVPGCGCRSDGVVECWLHITGVFRAAFLSQPTGTTRCRWAAIQGFFCSHRVNLLPSEFCKFNFEQPLQLRCVGWATPTLC